MTSVKIYLDSCIFVAYVHKKDKNNRGVSECISSMEQLDLDACSSDWALAEMVKVLVIEYRYPKEKALKLADKIRKEKKIGNISLRWLKIGFNKQRGYGSKEFFEHLRNQMLEAKDLHIADAIHSLIMSNNKIINILTTDKDFITLNTVHVIHPKTLVIIRPKK